MRNNRIVFCLLCFWRAGVALAPFNAEKQAFSDRVVRLTLNTQYTHALHLLDSALTLERDPAFLMLKLSAIGLRDMDFETVVDAQLFEKTYEEAIAILDRSESSGGVTGYSATLRGMLQASYAAYDLRKQNYRKALSIGLGALRILENAASLDSSIADADYFLGLYDWSRAGLRRRLWWVLFWLPGDRSRGLMRLERCVKSSLFSSWGAKLALLDIYSDAKSFDKAARVLSELLEQFPRSRFVWWGQARHLEAKGDLAGAAGVFGLLAESYRNESLGAYNELFCLTAKAELLERAGEYKPAARTAAEALERCDETTGRGLCSQLRGIVKRSTESDRR